MNTLAYSAGGTAQFYNEVNETVRFIDKRLVRGLLRIGTTPDGYALYSCKTLWSNRRRKAVLSQDVQKRYPSNVTTGLFGNLRVTGDIAH